MRYALLLGTLFVPVSCSSDDDPDGKTPAKGGGAGSGGGGSSGAGAGRSGAGGSSSGVGGAGTGGTAGSDAGGAAGSGGSSIECPPLAASADPVVRVTATRAGELASIVSQAAAGTTIVLEDGMYAIPTSLQLAKPGLTLRSAANDATKVTIDGAYQVAETIAISASNVTVAHVTVTRAVDHPIHVYTSGSDVINTRIYGVHLIDGGEQFLKVNPGTTGGYVDRGRVECSLFRMTDAGRPHVESCCGGCYTGGIDVHAGWDWTVRNNRFEGIYCNGTGLAEHAVHFWKGARGTLVENNTILDCARGIGFGLGDGVGDRSYPDNPNGGVKLAHYDGVIRNNVIWADNPNYDTGIELHIAKRPIVLHNTVLHGAKATGFFSSIDYRFAETDAFIANNLVKRITARDGASGMLANNLEDAPLASFVAAGSDFHLLASASAAIDKGQVHAEAGVDIDGQTHDVGVPDLGADEYAP